MTDDRCSWLFTSLVIVKPQPLLGIQGCSITNDLGFFIIKIFQFSVVFLWGSLKHDCNVLCQPSVYVHHQPTRTSGAFLLAWLTSAASSYITTIEAVRLWWATCLLTATRNQVSSYNHIPMEKLVTSYHNLIFHYISILNFIPILFLPRLQPDIMKR